MAEVSAIKRRLTALDDFKKVIDSYFIKFRDNWPTIYYLNNRPIYGPNDLFELAIQAQALAESLGPEVYGRLNKVGLDILVPFNNSVDWYNWSLKVLSDQYSISKYATIALKLDSEIKIVRSLIESDSLSQNAQITLTQLINSEVTMGDKVKYEIGEIGQLAALGQNPHAHDINFNQIWSKSSQKVDLKALATELGVLRNELATQAKEAKDYAELGAIADAEIEANKGDGPKTLAALAKAGKWTLDIAEKLGVGVAVAAIKDALGL